MYIAPVEPTPEPAKDDRRATLRWLLVAAAVFAGGMLYSRFHGPAPAPAPSWQRPVSELSAAQQRFYALLRGQLRQAERERASTKSWPSATGVFPGGWKLLRQASYVNYSGESEGLRWLVLFIEPDPRAAAGKAPPEDEEHHTLSDGTALHVTVWTQPPTEPPGEQVTAFPAAEGWVERVVR